MTKTITNKNNNDDACYGDFDPDRWTNHSPITRSCFSFLLHLPRPCFSFEPNCAMMTRGGCSPSFPWSPPSTTFSPSPSPPPSTTFSPSPSPPPPRSPPCSCHCAPHYHLGSSSKSSGSLVYLGCHFKTLAQF